MNTTHEQTIVGKQGRAGRLIRAGLIAIVTAVVANVIGYYVLFSAGMIPQDVIAPPLNKPITVLGAMEDTAIGVLGAVLVYSGLVYFSAKPVLYFRRIALLILLLSFAYPLLIQDIPLKMFIALNILHIIAGGAAVWALTMTPQGRQAAA